MNRQTDKIIITNLPSFYKINLYNRINSKKKLFVIFTGDTANIRQNDFFNEEIHFDYVSLMGYSTVLKLLKVFILIHKIKYKEIIICGVNELTSWLCLFLSNKHKNSTVIESSYHESNINGLKGYLKKIFFKRISLVYASGKSQEKLARLLNYNGKIIITKGVGIFNIITQPTYTPSNYVKKFIYVGRLSPEKNLEFIINIFNNLPYLELHMIGYGPQENILKSISNKNIIYHGAINNKELTSYYQKCDVFILPSIKEPWGLVVEEALNNGLPVLLSNKVGCAEEILIEGKNGYSFVYNSKESLLEKVNLICNIDNYNQLRKNISKLDFEKVANYQVNCYLNK